MKRVKPSDGQAKAELIREAADEFGDGFTIAGLTEHLLKEGLWGTIPARLHEELRRLVMRGAMTDAKRALKSEKMLNGACAWVALSAGPQAEWMRWSRCSRKQSRAAVQVLRQNERDVSIERKRLQELHEDRYKERLTFRVVDKKIQMEVTQ